MAKFKVGDRVKAKNPAWVGYQGHALGTDVYTVKKVDWDGTVKLDGFLDLWISPDSLVAANSRSRNAKFKVGDTAFVYDDWDSPYDGKGGTVVKVDRYVHVKFRDGSVVQFAEDELTKSANSRAANAKDGLGAEIKEGDSVKFLTGTWRGLEGKVVKIEGGTATVRTKKYGDVMEDLKLIRVYNSSVRSTIPVVNAALNGSDDAIIRLCNPGNLVEESKAGSLHEVRYGAGFVYPLIGKDGVLVRVFRSLSEAHRSPLLNAALGAARNGAASVCNDKWIDDFHVIVSAGKPDASLVEALKKKAKAWKIARRNFSDSEAGAAHDKAEEEAKAIAKRLGARWVQQGAVLKVVMPNAAANAVATDLRRYVPQKLIPHLEEAYKDSDGYWFYFDDGVENTRTGGGSTVHEDSISEAVSTMRAMRIVSKNAVSHNARPLGKGEILRRGDYVETPYDGAIGRVVGVKILDRDKGSAVYKVKIEKTGTVFDFPGHHLKVV